MSVTRIPICGGHEALIDEEDLAKAGSFSWHLDFKRLPDGSRRPHRVRANDRSSGVNRPVSLHRLVMGFPGELVDHINGNPLDNRKANLRTADHRGNRANAKPKYNKRYKGITASRSGMRFEASIQVHGKKVYLGSFGSEEDAAMAYDAAARKHFGEFARLNFKGAA